MHRDLLDQVSPIVSAEISNAVGHKTAVEVARAAYNALSDEQKAKVSAEALKKLTDAEAAISAAEKEAETEAQEKITIARTPKIKTAKVNKNKVTLTWKKIKKNKKGKKLLKKIKRIQIQYSTDKNFKKNVKTKILKKGRTSVTLKLKKKKTYYIRIRYVGKDGYSKWVKRKVRTK